jgi:predicted Ser/Thr protein kinase
MSQPGYLAAGAVLKGRYEIQREIGRGGYSVVYLARDRELDAPVAIKLLVPPPAVAQVARERLRREVQFVRELAHANIVAVYDFGDEGPWSFVVMEHVGGPDLQAAVRDRGPLAPERAARIGRDIAAALGAAHRRGILHRDVKPQNVLLDPDGRARLADFGSARLDSQASLTQTGGLVGTLAYLAPELLAGRRADARADIYALGLTLYYALVGALPAHPSPHQAIPPAADGFHPRAARTDVPSWLDHAIARATCADPSDRFAAVAALGEALADERLGAAAARGAPGGACAICGVPEPLGLGVCPRCGGADVGAHTADTLVFTAGGSGADREALAAHLGEVLGDRVSPAERAAVAWGARPLVRVSAAAADRVVERLADRGIRAVPVALGRRWTMLPTAFYGLVLAIVGVGMAAGIAALPLLLWTTPLVALLVGASAWRSVSHPVVAPARRAPTLPPDIERRVVEALGRLPTGAARSLLGDAVRLGQGVFAGRERAGDSPGIAASVGHLLEAACDAAERLSALDHDLALLEARGDRLGEGAREAWARCERARDALAQRLLDAVALLTRLQALEAERAATGAGELRQIVVELEEEAKIEAQAAKEVAALTS